MKYSATYYDGKTSLPYEAQVDVFGNSLTIYYNSMQVVWAITAIDYSSFTGKGKTMLKYGDFPHQYLEFPIDSDLSKVLEKYLPKRAAGFWAFANEMASSGFKGVFISVAIFLSTVAGIYFIALPSLAAYVAGKIPMDTEIELGKQFYKAFVGNADIDSRKTRLLNKFASKIDFETAYPLKFTVVRDNQVNAFALPGGNIVVYSGILEKIKSPEELAALLSHEVTHVKERHSLKGLARSLAGSMLISIIVGDMTTIGNIMVSQANNIYQLSFSRDMEKEADLEGLEIMNHNHLNPQGMVHLMERLQDEEKKYKADQMPGYLSSHPMTKDRISYIKQQSKGKTGEKNKDLDTLWQQIQGSAEDEVSEPEN
ncbi:M48 family metallopeptidase [Emticicia sp. 17c]|uniref:M48 family metallopeptidase n=1 Tax=Emticicia sp. 17c TaxID=3127704 RepID=UPI00301B8B53